MIRSGYGTIFLKVIAFFLLLVFPVDPGRSFAGDDQAYEHQCNVQRTGYTSASFDPPYELAWEFQARNKPAPAWKEPLREVQRIDFDYAFPAAIAGGHVFIASSADHTVRALDLETGKEEWTFFTQGPVRLSPSVHNGRVYFGSDDGAAYCLEADSGKPVWQFRPEVPDDRLIGNGQMISRWACRSGVMVNMGRAYVAFGMWADGVFIYCLDAASGSIIWCNDTSGLRFMTQPHYQGMGGVSPQGYLALCEQTLVVPCGRATPALFNAENGKLIYHEAEGLFPGGAWTMTWGDMVFTRCEALGKPADVAPAKRVTVSRDALMVGLNARTGKEVFHLNGGSWGVVSDKGVLSIVGGGKLLQAKVEHVIQKATQVKKRRNTEGHFVDAYRKGPGIGPVYALLQTGKTLIAGQGGKLVCYEADTREKIWEYTTNGDVRHVAFGVNALIASTSTGHIYCFRKDAEKLITIQPSTEVFTIDDSVRLLSDQILGLAGIDSGFALVPGEINMELLAAIAEKSNLNIYQAADTGPLGEIRRRLDDAGLYGRRITIHRVSLNPLPYIDYFADLIVAEESICRKMKADELYRVLRPCGGVAIICCSKKDHPSVIAWLKKNELENAEITTVDIGVRLVRGQLPGAGSWTHPYADTGRSCASEDQLARLPFKVQWFGGPGPGHMVNRHYRPPVSVAVNGRLFIPGSHSVIALNAYNGRELWRKKVPDVGRWPAAYRGGAVAADENSVYALRSKQCLRLDARTGKTLSVYDLPEKKITIPSGLDKRVEASIKKGRGPTAPGKSWKPGARYWEYLAVTPDTVVGTLGHPHVRLSWWPMAFPANYGLFALEKNTGKVKWIYQAQRAIDSNAIAISGNRVFLIDGLPLRGRKPGGYDKKLVQATKKNNEKQSADHIHLELKALDLRTGKELWSTGTLYPMHSSLFVKDGVVLSAATAAGVGGLKPQAGRGEWGGPIMAFSAKDGALLWKRVVQAPISPVLINDSIHLGWGWAMKLATGQSLKFRDPMTGLMVPFIPRISGGCGRLIGSSNLMMIRSGCLAFFDLTAWSGMYHYPNVRGSCWINTIPACGLVLVPDGSSACPCAYSYKTSLALAPSNRQNHWGISGTMRGVPNNAPVNHLCVNFGAHGDRPDRDGNLWYAFPRPSTKGPRGAGGMGGVSKRRLPVKMDNKIDPTRIFAVNPDRVQVRDARRPWLYTCGLSGNATIRIQTNSTEKENQIYRITLYFNEPETDDTPRVFSVSLQGTKVLNHLNIASETGGPNRALIKRFTVKAEKEVILNLHSSNTMTSSVPMLSALELEIVTDSSVPTSTD